MVDLFSRGVHFGGYTFTPDLGVHFLSSSSLGVHFQLGGTLSMVNTVIRMQQVDLNLANNLDLAKKLYQ